MKSALRSFYLLATLGLVSYAASAQTSPNYRADTGTGTVEKRSATETLLATTFTYGSYSTSVAAPNTATTDIFQLSSAFGAQLDGRALVWRQNNTGTTLASGTTSAEVNTASPFKSSVTLTFSREVSNLSLTFQDIDRGTLAGGGGSDYTDEVDFYALDDDKVRIDLVAANAKYGTTGTATSSSTCAFINDQVLDGVTQDAIRGTALNGGATNNPSRNGNVTVTFANPVRTVRLTFRNLNTLTSSQLRLQTIGLEQVSWTSQADLTTTIAGPATTPTAGSSTAFNVSFKNVGDLATSGVVANVQLPKNLNVTNVTNGGTYAPNTGLVSYNSLTALAYQQTVNSVITFTAPAAGTVVAGVSAISTTTSEGLNPQANSASKSFTVAAPLPVELSAFEAAAAATGARLTWTTASEKNSKEFAIERSSNGKEFTQAGTVAAHGTSTSPLSYSFADATPVQGTVYYRLRQVDFDGTTSYSPVRTVKASTAVAASAGLYPNPAAATDAIVTLDLRNLAAADYQASILNPLGSVLRTSAVQGGQAATLDIATLPAGTYLVLVQGNGQRLTQRLVRQ